MDTCWTWNPPRRGQTQEQGILDFMTYNIKRGESRWTRQPEGRRRAREEKERGKWRERKREEGGGRRKGRESSQQDTGFKKRAKSSDNNPERGFRKTLRGEMGFQPSKRQSRPTTDSSVITGRRPPQQADWDHPQIPRRMRTTRGVEWTKCSEDWEWHVEKLEPTRREVCHQRKRRLVCTTSQTQGKFSPKPQSIMDVKQQ